MAWQCPDCTYLNRDGPACCSMCGHPLLATVTFAAGGDGAQRQQQQRQQDAEVVDLVSEDEEQHGGGMGSGSSKATLQPFIKVEEADWGDRWDEDFQVQLSDSRSLATSSHRLQQQLGGSDGGAAAVAAAAQVQQPSGSVYGDGQRLRQGSKGQAPASAGKKKWWVKQGKGVAQEEQHPKKRRGKQGKDATQEEQQLAQLHRAVDEQGSGSSAKTAIAVQTIAPPGRSASLEPPPPQPKPFKCPLREDSAASFTSGSPVPLASRAVVGARSNEQQAAQQPPRRQQLNKRPLEYSSEHVPGDRQKQQQQRIQQQRQQQQQQQQVSPSSKGGLVAQAGSSSVRATEATQAASAAPREVRSSQQQQQQEAPPSKKARLVAAQGGGSASRASQAPVAACAVPPASLSMQMQHQPSEVPKGLQLPLPSSVLGKRSQEQQSLPWAQLLPPQPSTLLMPALQAMPATAAKPAVDGKPMCEQMPASPGESTQPRLPKQASLRLPPRRSPTERPHSASPHYDSAAAAPSAALCAGKQEPSHLLPKQLPSGRPPLPPSAALDRCSRPAKQQQDDAAAELVLRESAGKQPFAASLSLGPEAWQRGLAAFYSGAYAAAAKATPQEQQQQRADLLPTWVHRAKQSGEDLTAAVLGAAGRLLPVGNQQQQSEGAEQASRAVPGWLAYRVAAQMPEAAGCRSASDVVQVGAAALEAAAPPVPGAIFMSATRSGITVGEQAEQVWLDLSKVAALLLAASQHQPHPVGLSEHCKRFFSQRVSTVRAELKKRLAAELGQPSGTASLSTGSRRAAVRLSARAVCPPQQPSRLRQSSAAGGRAASAGKVPGGGTRRIIHPTAGAAYRGVRAVESRGGTRYEASTSVASKQLWLGTFPSLEAGARAVDLVCTYRWLCDRDATQPPTFNLPQNNYLQDGQLLRELTALRDNAALKKYIKHSCGASKGQCRA